MRRLLVALVATFLVLSANVFAQDDDIIHFPDSNFKKVLVNMQYCIMSKIDLNEDGEIQYSEAAAYTEELQLNCDDSRYISDLTGIKEFINVKKITFERTPLINKIDISGMVNLEEVDFNNCWNLEELNASDCKNLEKINCSESKVKYLNVENCIKLKSLWCGNNNLKNLNLINCCSLKLLSCNKNNLENLVFQQCINLEVLNCSYNNITSFNLTLMNNLQSISCNNNKLDLLNVRNGNNKSIPTFRTYGNPDLKCITVDDPAWSKEHWKEIDKWTEFSEDCSTSINETPQNTFKVYPNPADNSVTIQRVGIEQADLRILDITGRIYVGYTIPFGEAQTKLDVSMLPAGKYILEINNVIKSLIIE